MKENPGVVGIAGLGLIGGSFAKAVKARTNAAVLGFDVCENVMSLAREQGAIDGELVDSNLAECDIVIAALYPADIIAWCESRLPFMRKGAILVDCGGVKTQVCARLSKKANSRGIRFVGGHPMAGVERSGFVSSFAELFEKAAMILCKDEFTDAGALAELSTFFTSLGFGKIKITSAREHDEIIAYTSQLAHIVSSAYIQSDTVKKRYGFSAGSFKDLTRVAQLNEEMWTALFFENRENLLQESAVFLEWMQTYHAALEARDTDTMKALLKNGTERKINDEAEEKKWLLK